MNRPRPFVNPGVIEMHFLGGEAETQAEDLLTRRQGLCFYCAQWEWTHKMVGIHVRGQSVIVDHIPNERATHQAIGMLAANWTNIVEPYDDEPRSPNRYPILRSGFDPALKHNNSASVAEIESLLSKREYSRLLSDLQRIIREGKEEAERAAAQALIESYWSIGKRIAKEKLTKRAGFHNAILRDLSTDLGIDLRTLQRSVTFYRTYKRAPRVEGLSWAHYRVLMQLRDPDERGFYEELAVDESLSVKRLTVAIRDGHYEGVLEHPDGKLVKIPRPTDPSYLYKAEVRDVIDADTVLLDIDLGFEVIRRQSIRLARIDAPPRQTSEGALGRRFVREQLATARTIVVSTRKYDIHRRYVAHLFYVFNNRGIEHTFAKGRYLNQELVTKGFARVV
ncbi:MAG: hypothetical protein KJO40_20085 [Deltaproteobacteria bacterium]|nr:hypothetical protein [Deltaproteobacteria bacterium]NND27357.1 hypothetical protein [Myxococcales bacterium]MBT8465412.1 hypothetical protein [Deltaproteobacteria bacterium]NNK09496.1 hypothetical protein [Myxococcales bacterium]NNK41580.1 hypothetical protein [Myxococcales bacterium]